MILLFAVTALAQGVPDCAPRQIVCDFPARVFAPPELWRPAQDALGWVAARTEDSDRLVVAELPVRRDLQGLLSTVPGVSKWSGDVQLDGVSVTRAGGFTMR